MPKVILGQPVDEKKWAEAKRLAAEEGHSEDYAYIMGIYKRMSGLSKAFDPSGLVRVPVTAILDGKPYQTYRWKRPAQAEAKKKESWFERAGDTVDGLEVLGDIPNQSSISASLNEYEVLPGIREVPMSAFVDSDPYKNYYAADDIDHVHNLAAQIKQSRKIKPLIVVIDKEGPYILEGGHRWSALGVLGKKSFPALVVMDTEDYDVEKSLTFSGWKLEGRRKVHGMDISIENKKGSVRRGKDKDGHAWATKMHADYGYIRGTVGKDKDHLDCYVGPNPESTRVFIVHQNDPTTGKYDEDKIILAVDTPEEAKALYMKQYDRPGFFGSMDETDIETFKAKAFADSAKGKKLVIKKSEDAAIESASEVIDEKTIEFYQKFYDMMKGKDGHLDINGNRYKLKDLEGFPKGLDLENCAVMRIDAPVITFAAGGDWQQDVYFGVGLSKDRKLKVVSLYEERGRQSKDEIRTRIKVIERCSGVSPKLVVKAMKQRGSRFFTEEELRAKGAAVDVTTPPRIITTEELRMGRMLTDAELRERHAKGQGRILTEKELRDKVKRQREEKFIERRNPDELAVGVKVEMEHTDDPAEARKIAFDHLIEDRHYYKKLLAAGLVDEAEAIEEAKKVGLKKSIRLDSPKDSQGPIKITVWALQ